MTAPEPRPGILAIKPYVGGRSGPAGDGPVYKLSSNESALGPSPLARQAFLAAADTLALYPDGSHQVLRDALADRYGLSPERIICGNGSDEILSYLAQAYLGPGDEVLYSAHGFLMYRLIALANGATPVAAPENELRADVDALLAAVSQKTRIVFIANPNNPTGTYLPMEEVRRLHAGLPERVLLVIDAAYAEYMRANDYESGIELAGSAGNVVMTRTFSKIHALAALRLGWAYGPADIIDVVNRIRGPFNVTAPALAAGAASLGDIAHLEAAVVHNETWRTRLTDALTALGLEVTPSAGNFVLIRFPGEPGRTAGEADRFLNARGIYLRDVAAYGLPDCLRMTVGSADANEATIDALTSFLRSP